MKMLSALLAGILTAFGAQAGVLEAGAQTSAPAPIVTPDKSPLESQTKPAAKDAAKAPDPDEVMIGDPVRNDKVRGQRNAAKLYLKGAHLLEQRDQAEAAWGLLKQAAELEPQNAVYARAAELARQSAVTQVVEHATQLGLHGDAAGAMGALQHALEIDPKSESAVQHLKQLSDQIAGAPVGTQANLVLAPAATIAAGPIELKPETGKHSFHLRTSQQEAVKEVFKAFGIEADVHESVPNKEVKIDAEDATFPQAMRVLALMTNTFYEVLDPHRVVVALDSRENRTQFQRMQMETIELPGLTATELTDVSNLARNIFDAQQSAAEPTTGTLTVRASGKTLRAFNQTVSQLVEGKSQLDLDVKIIQVAQVSDRETGTTFFQQTGAYNVLSEVTSVLSQNQSLVQQIISSGLVPDQNTLAHQIEILAILVASGQLTGTPFNQGFLPFGGGITQSIITPGPATLTMSLNSSDTRELDDIHMRLGDQETGTFRTGERYPIESSSLSISAAAQSAATSAGISTQSIPQVQYEDLGLTLKATPKIMRSQDVALTIDLKIEALGGAALNNIPVLDNRSLTGVLTLRAGETAVLLSDLTRQESRALSGLPGAGDIPGLQDISDIKKDRNYSRLLILVTPSVVREQQQAGHSPIFMVDKSASGH